MNWMQEKKDIKCPDIATLYSPHCTAFIIAYYKYNNILQRAHYNDILTCSWFSPLLLVSVLAHVNNVKNRCGPLFPPLKECLGLLFRIQIQFKCFGCLRDIIWTLWAPFFGSTLWYTFFNVILIQYVNESFLAPPARHVCIWLFYKPARSSTHLSSIPYLMSSGLSLCLRNPKKTVETLVILSFIKTIFTFF